MPLGPLRRLARSEFVRHGAVVFVATMTVNVFGYLYHSLNSRKLGVDAYGVLSALNAAYMISLFAGSILQTIVVKYAAEFRAVDDLGRLRTLGTSIVRYVGSAALVVLVAGSALNGVIGRYLHIDSFWAIELAVLIIAVNLLLPVLRGVLQGVEDFWAFAASNAVESTLKAGLGVWLVYAGYGVVGALAGWLTGSLIGLAFTVWSVLGKHGGHAPEQLSLDVRRLLLTSANVALAVLFMTSLSYADVLLVKHFSDPTTAGLYGALSLSGKMLFFLVSFVPTVVLPMAARRVTTGASPLPILLLGVASIAVLAGTGLFVYSAFPAFVITTLAGKAFAPAAPLVFPYAISTVVLALLNAVVFYRMGIHRFAFVLPLALVALGELAGITFYHATLLDVIEVLIAANVLGLLAALYRLNAPLGLRARVESPSNAAA